MTKYLRLYLLIFLLFLGFACQSPGTMPIKIGQTEQNPSQDNNKLSATQPIQVLPGEKPFSNARIYPENAAPIK